jgi:hypothetical protein
MTREVPTLVRRWQPDDNIRGRPEDNRSRNRITTRHWCIVVYDGENYISTGQILVPQVIADALGDIPDEPIQVLGKRLNGLLLIPAPRI